MVEKKGGEEVGFGRVKEEKGREGWREREKVHQGAAAKKEKRNCRGTACWLGH